MSHSIESIADAVALSMREYFVIDITIHDTCKRCKDNHDYVKTLQNSRDIMIKFIARDSAALLECPLSYSVALSTSLAKDAEALSVIHDELNALFSR